MPKPSSTTSRTLNRDSVLSVYDKLTGLIEKLPGGLQKPILRELLPIRELFLEERAPRILLLGASGPAPQEILESMGTRNLETGGSDNGWREYLVENLGSIRMLEARGGVSSEVLRAGLARFEPDLVLFFEPLDEAAWTDAVARAALSQAPILGIASGADAKFRLHAKLSAETGLSRRVAKVIACDDPLLDETICATLPRPAQLQFARLTGARRAQALIAGSLLKSFSAVCGVIGVQPIPLADLPVLTTIQTLMVGMIIHTTGRPFSLRLVAEFLGALGLSVGAGLAFREGARAVIRVVPGWGNAVSGFIAGAGTYAIGRAAISYFIEETPIEETRRIFRRFRPKLGKQSPPELPG